MDYLSSRKGTRTSKLSLTSAQIRAILVNPNYNHQALIKAIPRIAPGTRNHASNQFKQLSNSSADNLFRLIPKADRKKVHEYLFRGMYRLALGLDAFWTLLR